MSKLKFIKLRGEGYFCTVKKYKDEKSNKFFALKELKPHHYENSDYRYRFNREIYLLNKLHGCENIIEVIKSGENVEKKKLWYLMPFADDNLYNYIKKNNSKLTLTERFEITQQIIRAIKFAHDKNIIHRDLSPNNILVFKKEKQLIIKVSDFGLGKDKQSLSYYSKSSASGYGQILYVSPEQIKKLKDATIQSDIYSLGKLIYFIFTGKDPKDLKQFELSSLVNKCIEENPQDRFANIDELEKHFMSLKDLLLDKKFEIDHLTLKEILKLKEKLSFIKLHQILVKGYYIDHVYYDYIEPVNELLLSDNYLENYYKEIGSSIVDFVKTYSKRIHECYQTVRWPFSSMKIFGELLSKIIKTVNDAETKLISFKELWYLAFISDQWAVQKIITEVLDSKYITSDIETQLAEYIINTEEEVEMSHFTGLNLPPLIRSSIYKVNKIVKIKEQAKKEQQELKSNNFDW